MRIRLFFPLFADPDPYPAVHFDADPDPDPGFQRKAKNLEKVLKQAHIPVPFGFSSSNGCGSGYVSSFSL
jgi:hypothetical protein